MNQRLKISKFPEDAKEFVVKSLPNGINDHMLCTAGIKDTKTGTFSVSANKEKTTYTLDAVGSSRILKGKQKLGLTFDSDKLKSGFYKNVTSERCTFYQ